MKILHAIAPASLLVVAASAQASIVIDDFTSGPVNLTLSSVSSLESQQYGTNAHLRGGQRDVLFKVTADPYHQSGTFLVDPLQGASFLSSGPGVATRVSLDYDGLDAEGNDGSLSRSITGLNLDLSKQSDLRFNFLFSDLGLNTKVDLFTYGGGHSQGQFSVDAGIASSKRYDLSLSSLTSVDGSGVDLSNVDRIVFTFDGSEKALDFGLRSVQAVPEPTSMAAVGLGLFGLLRRRRAKKG